MLERKNHVSHYVFFEESCQLTRSTCIGELPFACYHMLVFSTAVCIGERHAHNDSKMTCTQHSKSKDSIRYHETIFFITQVAMTISFAYEQINDEYQQSLYKRSTTGISI